MLVVGFCIVMSYDVIIYHPFIVSDQMKQHSRDNQLHMIATTPQVSGGCFTEVTNIQQQ